MSETAQELFDILSEKKATITFAESCTAGLLSGRFVDVPGASNVFSLGFVTYSDKIKRKILKVKKSTLEKHTAVSKECAAEMAKNAAKIAKADVAVSVTGYAGGNDADDPLNGLVYVGCYVSGHLRVKKLLLQGNRNEVRNEACDKALEFCLKRVKKHL